MAETINKGWIKSPDEIKFAPKTFAEQVIVNGETTLDSIINKCPTLDTEDTEGTVDVPDYATRIEELEIENTELRNQIDVLNSKIAPTQSNDSLDNLNGLQIYFCHIGKAIFIAMRGTLTSTMTSMETYSIPLNGKITSNSGVTLITLGTDCVGQIMLSNDEFRFVPYKTMQSGGWFGGAAVLIDY